MTRYVFRNGRWRDPATEAPMPIPKRKGLCAPMVQGDLPAYRSPIDGKWVDGRRDRRYDLESNNCVEYEPPKGYDGRLKNAHYAKRFGLEPGQKFTEAKR